MDSIYISCMPLTRKQVEFSVPEDHFDISEAFQTSRELYELQLESHELLRKINEGNRELGNFLHNLNKRIELITRSIATEEIVSGEFSISDATISEGGISFTSNELLAIGSYLALKLWLTPACLGLTCFLRVQHCRLNDQGDDYRIGGEFVDLDPITRRLIARHVIHKQAEERRQRLRDSLGDNLDVNHVDVRNEIK
ncbi:MAG: PilZ domain-containing protein [Pseudomonadales bacterium]|nr:PilZ domain-containing protein [Pseudomonadales bacterium]